ncbi:MAG: LapA family protein [Deltaproteobacteria bacterium]|nr:LapA family protein [Deltaproteobacteria bacterium]
MSIPIYVLFLLSFFVGVLIASFYGLIDRIRLKSRLRAERKEVSRLTKELESTRSATSPAPGLEPAQESYIEERGIDAPPALEIEPEPEKRRKDD